jgi:acetyltransferase-like isoleucine patch superfamily enzyme
LKSTITAFITFIIPINGLKIFFLKLLGHKVSYASKIGCSFLKVSKLQLSKKSRIGHFNLITIEALTLNEKAFIKHLNRIKGSIELTIKERGSITNQNTIRRAKHPITYGKSVFELGENTQVVSKNFFDLTKSIKIGRNSQLAGIGSQFWTHSYKHFEKDERRIRIDGEIVIGDHVYIGSRCMINAGIKISDSITVGSNSVVSKDLVAPGLYVNQQLRYLEKVNDEAVFEDLKRIEFKDSIDEVYEKQIKP